ncbi:PspC domain-containing protein [Urechidicola croceus]|uniref:Uncharacterized protein n=1 Tax=Urechidicola croceus TaxID=1850246 RepID=A0A1D8PB83_9FLAO|nr:PspC domain-containing protein [Urechidicola croceus]AOW21835.1 hypothetical protein LPB138_14590 [Urechidicola croceus]
MNKTININLGGLFFHIDENAFQKLKRYLEAIRKSLSDDPQGRDEIIKDIESRISELLSDKIVDERQVVSEADIDDVITIMGQPEDYSVDEELFTEDTYSQNKRKSSKKLFRDGDDKFLGGVASGTAHYVNIDVFWSRIIWFISAFATSGASILVYILMWILLPEAKSTSEKLEMKGEAVNIDNIEKKIREEINSVTERVKDGTNNITEKISNADYQKYTGKAKSGFQDFLDTLGKILIVALKIFAKFVGAIIIFASVIALISLIVSAFTIGTIGTLGLGDGAVNFPTEIFNSYLPNWLIILFGFFALAIPCILIFILGLKILSNNTKSFNKVTSLTLLAIWIISIAGIIFSIADFASRYKYKGMSTTKSDIELITNDTLNIAMIGNEDYHDSKYYRNSDIRVVYDNDIKKLYSNDVDLDIRKSDTENTYLRIRKEARGGNYQSANENAEKLEYQFNLSGSDLKLDNYFLNEFSRSFFDQEIDVILYVPEGQIIYLDKSTRRNLNGVSNVQDIYDRNMVNHYYIMGESELDCLDCEKKEYVDVDRENVNLKINDEGLNFKAKDDDGDSVEINIDKTGVTIK